MCPWTFKILAVQVLIFNCCWDKGLAVMMCPGNMITPLLLDARITENDQLSSLSGHDPSQVNLTGAGWCSNKLLSIVDPYLQFDFDVLYRIFYINITGATNRTSYVRELRVESETGNGVFQFISTNGVQIFNTSLTNATEAKLVLFSTIGFPSRSLRIRPYSWSENPPCMRLEIHGCPADPANIAFPQDPNSETDTQLRIMLAAALPIAVITILIVAVIAIISVTACYYMKYRYDEVMKFSETCTTAVDIDDDRTIKHVKNEIYLETGREGIEESTASSGARYTITTEPQPYEKPRQSYSGTLTNSNGYTVVDLNCSSSMSSAGYAKVKKKKVKAYKTVSLENLTNPEMAASQSGDPGYSQVQSPSSETAAFQSSDPGYSVVNSPTSEIPAAQVSDTGYAVVESPTIETAATQSSDLGYSAVQSYKLTNDRGNHQNMDHLHMEQELGVTESYGPEHFEV